MSEEKHKCPECGSLNNHKETAFMAEWFVCDDCGKTFDERDLKENQKEQRREEFEKMVSDVVGKIPDDVCCCCGHKLGNHVDEKDGWRCHSLGQDFYQCECYLRKGRYDKGIKGYDLKLRVEQMKGDLKKER